MIIDADKEAIIKTHTEKRIKEAFNSYITSTDRDFNDFQFNILMFYLYNASSILYTISNIREGTRDYTKLPLFLYDTEENKIIYFPNFPSYMDPIKEISRRSSVLNGFLSIATRSLKDYIEFFCRTLLNDKTNIKKEYLKDKKLGKWKTDKVYSSLRVHRSISPLRYFLRLGIDSGSASYLVSKFKPVKTIITQDIKEMIRVYEDGPSSCMVSESPSAVGWRRTYKKEGFHPLMFYAAIPDIGIAYIQNSNKRITYRALVNVKNKTYYSTYSGGSESGSLLITGLTSRGYKRTDTFLKAALPKEMKIKGVWSEAKKDYLCPVPYVDGTSFSYYVSFDIKTKKFKYTKTQKRGEYKGRQVSFRSQGGYVKAKNCFAPARCSCCHRNIERHVFKYKSSVFCSIECAGVFSLTVQNTADNEIVVVKTRGVFDKYSGKSFTSVYSANKNLTRGLGLKTGTKLPNVYLANNVRDLLSTKKSNISYTWYEYENRLYLCNGTLYTIPRGSLKQYLSSMEAVNSSEKALLDLSKTLDTITSAFISRNCIPIHIIDLNKISTSPRNSDVIMPSW